jgi:RNA polymerase sigma-70 factor, ECF subfamily
VAAALGDLATELADIAERIRGGDREAESELVLRYQCAARVIARRHCRPQEPQVDDIVQDVLADLLQRLRAGLIEDPRALPHYLQLSIRNACTALYRRQSRWLSSGDLDPVPEDGDEPAEFQARQQRAQCLRDLVAELPVARDRELLRRFYLLEHSRAQVCSEMDIDESHFRRVIHRARQRLREVMELHGLADLW